jgi:hypothetical protein
MRTMLVWKLIVSLVNIALIKVNSSLEERVLNKRFIILISTLNNKHSSCININRGSSVTLLWWIKACQTHPKTKRSRKTRVINSRVPTCWLKTWTRIEEHILRTITIKILEMGCSRPRTQTRHKHQELSSSTLFKHHSTRTTTWCIKDRGFLLLTSKSRWTRQVKAVRGVSLRYKGS